MICSVKPREENCELFMTILLRMEDKMNRQLTCPISPDDSAVALSHELVHLGFIHETDREKLASMIEDTLRNKQQQLLGAAAKMQSAAAQAGERLVATDGSGTSGSDSTSTGVTTTAASTSNHLHHHVPVNSASLERGWRVADTDSLLATMPVIMETSGISVNSLDATLLASLDDAEEAREQQDEELEALEAATAAAEQCPEPTRDPLAQYDSGEYSSGMPPVHQALTSRTSILPEGELCYSETIESYEATE